MLTPPAPPLARQVPHEITLHGRVFNDPFFWLRDRSNPEVVAYLEAENAYTRAVMAHTAELQNRLYAEMRGRIKETDSTVPVRRGAYEYYSRTVEGLQYPIFCRRPLSSDAHEEVLLDQNKLAAGHAYCHLGAFEISPDHRLLAYSVDLAGNEMYTLYIKDLERGELLSDAVPNTYYSVEWANDNRTLFYNVLDDALRPFKVLRHTLGTDAATDVEVFHEPDQSFFVEVDKTRSRAFLLITLRSTTTSEVHFGPADEPAAPFRVLQPRRHGVEYEVEHHGERFVILTNDEAQNFKLVEAPVATPSREHWRDLIAHRPEVLIEGVDAFRDFLVVYEREQGLQQIRISDSFGDDARRVAFPEPVYAFTSGPNPEWDSDTLRFSYSSLVTPPSVIDYHMPTHSWQLRKQDEIPSGYDPNSFVAERIMATAADGTQIPISLVYRRGIARDGSHPLLLYGYGAYGISKEPSFQVNLLSLLERGVTFAIAHIRGGSELGRAWYEQGKLQQKKNTFTDFIACAEHLIASGYTSSQRLAIVGGSAGGLLMGAVVNMRPELFRAVVAHVPFVDVINTMSDPELPLTVIEYEQWGDPRDREAFEYMLSYAPYNNVSAQKYPDMLITAGLNDPRVSYWEPAKWTAKLRVTKTDNNRLLLKTNMDAGHAGASGRYDYLHEIAFEYAFVLDALGVEPAKPTSGSAQESRAAGP